MIGSLISICPAVQYGLLYTKGFEREKLLALQNNNENYEKSMDISRHLKNDFNWWVNVFVNPKQKKIIRE